MRKLAQLAVELIIIFISTLICSYLYTRVNIIPSFIFKYAKGFYVYQEFVTIFSVYLGTSAIILFVSKIIDFGNIFTSARYFSREIFIVSMSSCVSALVLFFFTKIFFDPNFIALQLLLNVIIYFLIFSALSLASGARHILSVFPELLRYAFSISGVLMIAISLSPVPLAVYFKKDKDFANTINQIRNLSDGLGLQWELVDHHAGLRLLQPLYIRQHPAQPGALLVLGKFGTLTLVNADGEPSVLLDFTSEIGIIEAEMGAVGFALHPEFGVETSPNRGFAYFHHTTGRPEEFTINIVRYDLSLPDNNARLASKQVLVRQQRNKSGFHNGGSIGFGPDGFLYFAVGEGNDLKNMQTISRDLFAGIFRIDVDSRGGDISHPIVTQPKTGRTANYMIPKDNPFVGQPGVLEEFWALGLRNPFRFEFDPETRKLWVGDVGAEQIEEVDIVEPGGNYQYPYFEGTRRSSFEKPAKIIGTEAPPYFEYRHKANERAVIGGVVYRGSKHEDLRGRYIFSDNASGQIYAIELDRPGQTDKKALAKTDSFGYVGIASVIQTAEGDILATTLGSSQKPTGRVLKLVKRDASLFGDLLKMAGSVIGIGGDDTASGSEDYTPVSVEAAYTENCSRCHGADGRGSKELDAEIARLMPDFTDAKWQSSRTDEQLLKVIVKGGEGVGKSEAMPPWEDVLDEKTIKGLIGHIRDFGPQSR